MPSELPNQRRPPMIPYQVPRRHGFASPGGHISNAPDILQELESLVPSFDLEGLVESSVKSFTSFKIFYEKLGTSDDPTITAIMSDITLLYVRCCDAIDESMSTAQNGYTFATDGLHLCDAIKKEKSVDKLTLFINDMIGLAKETTEKARVTVGKFRSVQVCLLEILKSIPQILAIHEQGHAGAALCECSSKLCRRFFNLQIYKTVFAASISFFEDLTQLLKGNNHFEDNVSRFAAWWIETEAKLAAVHTKAKRLDPRRVDKLRLNTVRRGWEDVENRYLRYNTKIAKLRDISRAELSEPTTPTALLLAAAESIVVSELVPRHPASYGSVPPVVPTTVTGARSQPAMRPAVHNLLPNITPLDDMQPRWYGPPRSSPPHILSLHDTPPHSPSRRTMPQHSPSLHDPLGNLLPQSPTSDNLPAHNSLPHSPSRQNPGSHNSPSHHTFPQPPQSTPHHSPPHNPSQHNSPPHNLPPLNSPPQSPSPRNPPSSHNPPPPHNRSSRVRSGESPHISIHITATGPCFINMAG